MMDRRDFLKILGAGYLGCCCAPLEAFAAIGQQTYSQQKLLKDFDGRAESRRAQYLPVLGEDAIEPALASMRDSYAALIPEIPYVGPRDYHLQWYIPNAEFLAEYLALKEYGLTAAQCAKCRMDKSLSDLLAMPEGVLRMIRNMQFGVVTELQMRYHAFISQLRRYPAAHVMYFVKGDGVDFDWGFDYMQCANCMLFKEHDAADLLFLGVCRMDYVAGKAFKTGYHRTMQLSTGDPKCDLRWKKGVESELPEV